MPSVPSTRYADFVAASRRVAPSVMLPVLAEASIQQLRGSSVYRPRTDEVIQAWIIAAAARENIAYGNEFRQQRATRKDLLRLRNTYHEMHDPFLNAAGQPDAVESLMVRTVFEQFPFAHSRFEDLSRILLLFDRDYSSLNCEVLSVAAWQEVLGAPLERFMRSAFFILVGALCNGGRFEPDWLSMPHFAPVFDAYDMVPAEVVEVFDRVFVADFGDVRAQAAAKRNPDPHLRRFDPNPLLGTPFVRMPDGTNLAPCVHLVAQRVSPGSLYYVGWDKWKNKFTRDLGKVTEAYVGEQLDLINPPVLLHDVEYKKGQRASDYVIGYPGLTIIVEVKSARVAHPGRLDMDGYLADVEKDVGEAMKRQIKATADLIKAGHPAFRGIDPGAEIRGIVVTAEPHYMLNSPMFRSLLPDSGYPTVILSLSELEFAVSAALVGDPAGLLRALTDWGPNGIDANGVASAHAAHLGEPKPRNPLLQDAAARGWAKMLEVGSAASSGETP
ncbi:hypothetical protein [Micromonospora sp. WMMD1274]|uniref:hypothetical protein n=1 Tax=Micromonospora sp. WMMD1274 TaxID=3404116 RepID=UPI003B95E9E8